MDNIRIFDTTLRDGEQSPGASLNFKQKLEVAYVLKDLNVDVIEAGFPIASPGDFEAVREVAKRIKGPVVCGLARARKEDIDRCYDAVKVSDRPRIHTFLATSPIHMRYKLKKTEDEVLRDAVAAVRYARKKLSDVEFSAEDAARSDYAFLKRVVAAVIEAGAMTVNIPDTVGYALPVEFGEMIRKLISEAVAGTGAVISVHCHNDLGLATANSISAVSAGARQIECTVNGLGERAGNASLEEIVMIMRTRKKSLNLSSGVNTSEITRASKIVSRLTGIPVQPNKAIVGANAFAHEAGIHQHGVMAKSLTYEIMTPSSVGLKENRIVLGKHSGRHAFTQKLKTLGYSGLNDRDTDALFAEFKILADKKKDIYDDDILALVSDRFESAAVGADRFELANFSVLSGQGLEPTAAVVLARGTGPARKSVREASCGDGPVDALFRAADRIAGFRCRLLDFSLKSVSSGKDAMGEALIKVKPSDGPVVSAHGSSTDILEAALKAYLAAINRHLAFKKGRAK